MIAYRVVPFLLLVAPPAIVLLAVVIGGCTMARTGSRSETANRTRLFSDPQSRAGEELVGELDRRAARADLERAMAEAER